MSTPIEKAVFAASFARTRWLARRLRTRADLERFQAQQLSRFLRFVAARSPYHAERLRAHGVDLARLGEPGGDARADWRTLPPIGKAEMMAHFDQLNTVGVRKDEAMELALRAERDRDFSPTVDGVTVGLSSGTSGSRGLFLVEPLERYAWAGTLLARVLPAGPPLLRPERFALFLRANSNLYETLGGRRLSFRFFDLLRPVEELAAGLDAFTPTVLAAPPSMLRLLAEARRAGRLKARPRTILSVAEVLDPLDARIIEEAFDRPLRQVYQCTEGFLGVSCEHGTVHLNEDLVYVQREWVDRASGRFTPILTDFSRRTQPILRHRLNDVLVLADVGCPCGAPTTALARIEGRADDVLRLPRRRGAGHRPVFPDFVSRAIIGASAEVREYAVEQSAPGALRVELEVAEGHEACARQAVADALEALWQRLEVVPPTLSFGPLARRPADVKLRRVRRSFHEGAPGAFEALAFHRRAS